VCLNSVSGETADSLQGVHVVFAVTNWWEHLFQGKTQQEAGEIEEEQGMSLARVAAATPSLEHYIWSTTPSAKRRFRGELLTPHMDYKANVDARIKSELPDLAAMTTYLYFGYYPQNMAFFPLIKPIEHVGGTMLSQKFLLTLVSPATASSSKCCQLKPMLKSFSRAT
jgi:NmrA-like family